MRPLPLKIVYLILVLVCTTFISCSKLWLKYSGILESKPELKTITNGEKTVVFLPLHHIGRKMYYEDIEKKIDSLQAIDFVVFYELVSAKDTNQENMINTARKFRKIQGDFQAKNGYLDTINNKIYGSISYDAKYNLVNQPEFTVMGIDTLTAVNADLSLEELVMEFEKKHGEVHLDSCDNNTGFSESYECEPLTKKLKKDFKKNYILGLRNKNLADMISATSSKNIFVIYGARHYKGMFEELREIDHNWKLLKK